MHQVQYLNDLSVNILAKISPRGSARIISMADANHEAETVRDMAPIL